MKFWSNLSIRLKIIITLIPALAVILSIVTISYRASLDAALDNGERLVKHIVAAQTHDMNRMLIRQAKQFQNWVAEDIYGMSIEFETTQELGRDLKEQVSSASAIMAVMITDRTGRILTSAGSGDREVGFLNNEKVEKAQELLKRTPSGVSMVKTELLAKMGLDHPQTYLFSFPTHSSEGKPNGLFLAYLDWSEVQRIIHETSEHLVMNGFPGATASLLDVNTLRVISHSDSGMIGEQVESAEGMQQWLQEGDDGATRLFSLEGTNKYLTLMHGMDPVGLETGGENALENSTLAMTAFVPEENILVRVRKILWLNIAIAAIGCVILIGLTLVVASKISNPVREITSISQRIARGDLTRDVQINQGDEIGQLADAFRIMSAALKCKAKESEEIAEGNIAIDVEVASKDDMLGNSMHTMVVNLNDILGRVAEVANQIASGSSQVSGSSQSLSQGATEQASSLEEITSSMTEMGSQTKTNAENANQANQLAGQAREAADKGNQQMQDMVTAMADINEAGQNISKIIKVIDEIAFQTNLLALNAAVEAARAGRHGKGFAVVAEEVRNLAARSAQAAKETAELIEGSVVKAGRGMEIARGTADALGEIVSSVTKVTDLVGEIAASSNEQAQGITQVNEGLEQIDKVTQQNTANAEESAAASEELSGQAALLKQILTRFTLKNQETDEAIALQPPQQNSFVAGGDDWGQPTEQNRQNGQSPPEVIALDDKEFGKY